MTKQIQTLKTMVDVSNMIINTMKNEFEGLDDDETYIYKVIDGLHYYIHCSIETGDTDELDTILDYSVIRTNYKIKEGINHSHPKKCFFGFMKHCMADRNKKFHTEEKLSNLNRKHQWYSRYDSSETQKTKDYQFANPLTQEQYDEIQKQYKKRKLPYGYELQMFCGKPTLMYDAPELLSITFIQNKLTVKEILNRTREMRKKIIIVMYKDTKLPLECIGNIMKFL